MPRKKRIFGLHRPTLKNDLDRVQSILDSGKAKLDDTDTKGRTPLHIAAEKDDRAKITELLLQQGSNPNLGNKEGNTPLIIAVNAGNIKNVAIILESSQLDLNITNKDGKTALDIAKLKLDHPQIERLIIQKHNQINRSKQSNEDLPTEVQKEDIQSPKNAAKEQQDRTTSPKTLQSNTAKEEQVEVLEPDEVILSVEQQKNYVDSKDSNQNDTPLILAIIEKPTDEVEEIIKQSNADDLNASNMNGHTALYVAMKYDRHEVVPLLIARKETDVNAVDKNGQTPLIIGIAEDSTRSVIELLKSKDLDLNATYLNSTAIYFALSMGRKNIAQILIEQKNIDLNGGKADQLIEYYTRKAKEQGLGNTALMELVTKDYPNHKEHLSLMLRSKNPAIDAMINEVNLDGYGVLHLAIKSKKHDIVKMLLEYEGIDANLQTTYYRETPLIYATKLDLVNEIKILIQSDKVDLFATDIYGYIALEALQYYPFDKTSQSDILRLLHKTINKDNIDQINPYDGDTILMKILERYAYTDWSKRIIKVAIEQFKPNLNIVNFSGDSILSIARYKLSEMHNKDLEELVNFLTEHGAGTARPPDHSRHNLRKSRYRVYNDLQIAQQIDSYQYEIYSTDQMIKMHADSRDLWDIWLQSARQSANPITYPESKSTDQYEEHLKKIEFLEKQRDDLYTKISSKFMVSDIGHQDQESQLAQSYCESIKIILQILLDCATRSYDFRNYAIAKQDQVKIDDKLALFYEYDPNQQNLDNDSNPTYLNSKLARLEKIYIMIESMDNIVFSRYKGTQEEDFFFHIVKFARRALYEANFLKAGQYPKRLDNELLEYWHRREEAFHILDKNVCTIWKLGKSIRIYNLESKTKELEQKLDNNIQDLKGNVALTKSDELSSQKPQSQVKPSRLISQYIDPEDLEEINAERKKLNQEICEEIDRINDVDKQGQTRLYRAVSSYNEYEAELLLEHGADPNIATPAGDTPLLLASKQRMKGLVELFLEFGAKINDINSTNEIGQTRLYLATFRRNHHEAKLLLEHGADPNIATFDDDTPLLYAVKDHYAPIVDLLVKFNADVNMCSANNETPLIVAAKDYNCTQIVDMILQSRDFVKIHHKDNNGKTVFDYIENAYSRKRITQYYSQHQEKIRLIEEQNLVASSQTNMHKAILGRWTLPDIEEILERQPEQVNNPDSNGNTPLMLAIKIENIPYIQTCFIKDNVDLSLKNHEGQSIFDMAEQTSKSQEITDFLLSKKRAKQKPINPKQKRKPYATTPIEATQENDTKTVQKIFNNSEEALPVHPTSLRRRGSSVKQPEQELNKGKNATTGETLHDKINNLFSIGEAKELSEFDKPISDDDLKKYITQYIESFIQVNEFIPEINEMMARENLENKRRVNPNLKPTEIKQEEFRMDLIQLQFTFADPRFQDQYKEAYNFYRKKILPPLEQAKLNINARLADLTGKTEDITSEVSDQAEEKTFVQRQYNPNKDIDHLLSLDNIEDIVAFQPSSNATPQLTEAITKYKELFEAMPFRINYFNDLLRKEEMITKKEDLNLDKLLKLFAKEEVQNQYQKICKKFNQSILDPLTAAKLNVTSFKRDLSDAQSSSQSGRG